MDKEKWILAWHLQISKMKIKILCQNERSQGAWGNIEQSETGIQAHIFRF